MRRLLITTLLLTGAVTCPAAAATSAGDPYVLVPGTGPAPRMLSASARTVVWTDGQIMTGYGPAARPVEGAGSRSAGNGDLGIDRAGRPDLVYRLCTDSNAYFSTECFAYEYSFGAIPCGRSTTAAASGSPPARVP